MDATENKAPCLCLHGSIEQGQPQPSKGFPYNGAVPSEGTPGSQGKLVRDPGNVPCGVGALDWEVRYQQSHQADLGAWEPLTHPHIMSAPSQSIRKRELEYKPVCF